MKSHVLRWVLCLFLITGCNQDSDGTNPADAPEIPPSSTFVIDFSDFNSGSSARETTQLAISNWGFAAGSVAFWNTVLTVTLAVPVAAYIESFNHEPTVEGTTFVWTYDVTVGLQQYTARLEGSFLSLQEVQWQMFVSQSGGFQNVMWYEGTSMTDGTSGEWLLFRDPDNPIEFLTIAWTRDPDSGTGTIRYTLIEDGAENENGFVAAATSTGDFDRDYEIDLPDGNGNTVIEWNSETKAGRVSNEQQFEDTDFHCWDEDLEDVDCPE